MKNARIIIATLFGSIIIATILLAYEQQRLVHRGENFWSVAFTDPLGATNDIIIDNRTPHDTTFHYRVHSTDDTPLTDADITIPTHTSRTIAIPYSAPLTITVTADDETFTVTKKENSLAQ